MDRNVSPSLNNHLESLLEDAIQAVRIGAAIDQKHFDTVRSRRFAVKDTHSDWNPVTEVDQLAEEAITTFLAEAHRGHHFLGEENVAGQVEQAEHLWIVDPIDGTANYIHGIPHYGVSVGYALNGQVMVAACLDPGRNELFTAVRDQGSWLNGQRISVSGVTRLEDAIIATGFYYDRGAMMERTLESIRRLFGERIHGIRRNGSAVLDLCWTAAGRFDAYFEYELGPWDFAPAALVLQEAGATVSRTDGSALTMSVGTLAAATPGIYRPFIQVIGDGLTVPSMATSPLSS